MIVDRNTEHLRVLVANERQDRLALIVNRANSGVSVADMEKTVGMPALALIRSGGLLFVRAANEGRTVIELYPNERLTEDFDALAQRLCRPINPRPIVQPVGLEETKALLYE